MNRLPSPRWLLRIFLATFSCLILLEIGLPLGLGTAPLVVAGRNEKEFVRHASDLTNIKLLGKVSDSELPQLVRAASSLMMLSRYEGFGIPPAEAMAAGVPVVVSATASLPEVVADAGLKVELNASEDAADKLELLRSDDNCRAAQIAIGLERAQQLTWQGVVKRIDQVLFPATQAS